MTLGELQQEIEDLIRLEGEHVLELEVLTSYDYGDHCHTEALNRFSRVEVINPGKTAYSDSGLCVREDSDNVEEEQVVALR